nr:uncharacterized protein LOC128692536 [Cherax quadricarinatus]
MATGNCSAWSLVQNVGGGSECRLARGGPTNYPTINATNATYFYRQDSIPGTYSWGKDGLLYLNTMMLKKYADAKTYCASIPGHRLGIFKTIQQKDILLALPVLSSGKWALDLVNNGTGPVWGDGTMYYNTELGQNFSIVEIPNTRGVPMGIYVYISGNITTGYEDILRNFQCQFNPAGVDW